MPRIRITNRNLPGVPGVSPRTIGGYDHGTDGVVGGVLQNVQNVIVQGAAAAMRKKEMEERDALQAKRHSELLMKEDIRIAEGRMRQHERKAKAAAKEAAADELKIQRNQDKVKLAEAAVRLDSLARFAQEVPDDIADIDPDTLASVLDQRFEHMQSTMEAFSGSLNLEESKAALAASSAVYGPDFRTRVVQHMNNARAAKTQEKVERLFTAEADRTTFESPEDFTSSVMFMQNYARLLDDPEDVVASRVSAAMDSMYKGWFKQIATEGGELAQVFGPMIRSNGHKDLPISRAAKDSILKTAEKYYSDNYNLNELSQRVEFSTAIGKSDSQRIAAGDDTVLGEKVEVLNQIYQDVLRNRDILARDGVLGQSKVDALLRKMSESGQAIARDHLRVSYAQELLSSEYTAGTGDSAAKAAFDTFFKYAAESRIDSADPRLTARNIIEDSVRAGYMPKPYAQALDSMAASDNPAEVILASEAVVKISRQRPGALSSMDGKTVTLLHGLHYRANVLKVDPASALQELREMQKNPDLQNQNLQNYNASSKAYTADNLKTLRDMLTDGEMEAADPGMEADYNLLVKSEYLVTGDIEIARRSAFAKMQETWQQIELNGHTTWQKNHPVTIYGGDAVEQIQEELNQDDQLHFELQPTLPGEQPMWEVWAVNGVTGQKRVISDSDSSYMWHMPEKEEDWVAVKRRIAESKAHAEYRKRYPRVLEMLPPGAEPSKDDKTANQRDASPSAGFLFTGATDFFQAPFLKLNSELIEANPGFNETLRRYSSAVDDMKGVRQLEGPFRFLNAELNEAAQEDARHYRERNEEYKASGHEDSLKVRPGMSLRDLEALNLPFHPYK